MIQIAISIPPQYTSGSIFREQNLSKFERFHLEKSLKIICQFLVKL